MSRNLKYRIITIFVWIGFVCSISFMEAWLKFRPENVTLPVALSIGRVVFGALNKIEWAFAFVITTHLFISKNKIPFLSLLSFLFPLLLLFTQTFLVLPVLNKRVDLLLSGAVVNPSHFHFYYVFAELIKVGCLFIFGIVNFKLYEQKDLKVTLS